MARKGVRRWVNGMRLFAGMLEIRTRVTAVLSLSMPTRICRSSCWIEAAQWLTTLPQIVIERPLRVNTNGRRPSAWPGLYPAKNAFKSQNVQKTTLLLLEA